MTRKEIGWFLAVRVENSGRRDRQAVELDNRLRVDRLDGARTTESRQDGCQKRDWGKQEYPFALR